MVSYRGDRTESVADFIARECRSRSIMIPGVIHYALHRKDGCFAYFTTSEEEVRRCQNYGGGIVCKMLDGLPVE